MAISQTTRVGVTRWSGGNDAFNRDQMDESHDRIETRLGTFYQGTIATRPAASATYARGFYLATDQNAPQGILYYCDGTAWRAVNAFNAPSAQTPGDAIAEGTAVTLARSDHKHALPGWGTVGEIAGVSTASSAGVLVKFARADHVHLLNDASVTAGKIAAGGVSASDQIASGIVQATHYANGSVGFAALATDQRVPPGAVIMWTGTTAPSGWLLCDGGSYATASYSNLFSVIGYKYGGVGANFLVPNMKDTVPRGAVTPGSNASMGVAAGADTVTIATTNLPAHGHNYSTTTGTFGAHTHTTSGSTSTADTNHYHNISGSTNTAGSHNHNLNGQLFYAQPNGWNAGNSPGGTNYDMTTVPYDGGHSHTVSGNTNYHSDMFTNYTHSHTTSGTAASAGDHTHTVSGTTANTGGGTALNVAPKSLTVNFIVKI